VAVISDRGKVGECGRHQEKASGRMRGLVGIRKTYTNLKGGGKQLSATLGAWRGEKSSRRPAREWVVMLLRESGGGFIESASRVNGPLGGARPGRNELRRPTIRGWKRMALEKEVPWGRWVGWEGLVCGIHGVTWAKCVGGWEVYQVGGIGTAARRGAVGSSIQNMRCCGQTGGGRSGLCKGVVLFMKEGKSRKETGHRVGRSVGGGWRLGDARGCGSRGCLGNVRLGCSSYVSP